MQPVQNNDLTIESLITFLNGKILLAKLMIF